MSLVFAAIAPHGDMELDPSLHTAMEELGCRFAAAQPDVAVVGTPHNVHVEGHFAVVTSARVGDWPCDRETARRLLGSAGVPIVGVSYGGNDASQAEMPLDWGSEVPLSYLRSPRVVVVAPARDRPLEEHVRLGEAIRGLPGRVALIASADNGHAHDPEGPYGFDPAAKRYDELLLELLEAAPLDFMPLAGLVEDAKADSLWQLLTLQGASRAEVLAYAAPTYYGMAVAEVFV